jgi:hypothetical protein
MVTDLVEAASVAKALFEYIGNHRVMKWSGAQVLII